MEAKFKTFRYCIIATAIAATVTFIIHFFYIRNVNSSVHATKGADKSNYIYFDLAERGESTSTWLKRDYSLYYSKVDLTGTTVDGTLYNNTSESVTSWALRVNIQNYCFINQAWNGEVEIHQALWTDKEVVQRINLQNYNLDDLEVEYLYDGDLLIPLYSGDYIIYYPSEKYKEDTVAGGESVTIGMIFYYLDKINLSYYELDYNYHKAFTSGVGFWIFVFLVFLLFTEFVVCQSIYITYKNAKKQLELQKSSISCMSDIYSIIYMIDLKKDELIPVYADSESEKLRPHNMGAREQLLNMFRFDAEDEYLDFMLEFGDIATIPERLKNKNSIVCEYKSKLHGWNCIRYFVMERGADDSVTKVLFTIQDIGEEKKELERVRGRIQKAESENRAKSAFLANMSHEIRTPINAVLGFDTMILRESREKNIKNYAREIKSAGSMLLSLINGILDLSKMEAGKMELVPAEYSIKQLIFDVYNITKTRFEAKNLVLITDISPKIPEKLYGDDIRLRQVIINIMTNAAKYTEKGNVRLTIKCETEGDTAHLHVSVKDTGIGIKEEDMKKLSMRYERFDTQRNRRVEGTGLGLSLVRGILELMDSELQVTSVYGKGSNFYFDVDQKIVDVTPIGDFDVTQMEFEDDGDYDTTFVAPDAKILITDDNPMNIMVMSELLKGTGMNIDKAASGKEALSKTLENKYDLIFMDHMMPGMDGIETFERIKAQEKGKNQTTPVIMLTANALQGARDEYKEKGFAEFVSKPVELSVLNEVLMRFLPGDKVSVVKDGENGMSENTNGNPNGNGHKVSSGNSGEISGANGADEPTLPMIEGIDNDYAVRHLGSIDAVIKVMHQFVLTSASDATELRSYYDGIKENPENKDNVNNFRIKVHAMKSSAALFGALQVSGVAAKLEYAARDEDTRQITDITPYFLDFWMKLAGDIKKYVLKDDDKVKQGKIPDAALPLFHQLKTSMALYDIKNADMILEEIKKYDYDDEKKKKIAELETAVANLDAERVAVLCDEFVGE